jgi:YbbR domain-containing protein
LSLAIAVAGWAYLRLTPNPVIAARFVQQFNVPLETTGLAPDEIARFADKQAVVAVDVPRGGAAIKPDMVRAVLDLEGRGPGVYNVPVEVIAPKLGIRSLSPASETLEIERIDERSVPIGVHYTGGPRRNLVVQQSDIAPAYATLRAPTDQLERVAAVVVEVPFRSEPSTFDAMVQPVAIDSHGSEIAAVAVTPNLVRVRLNFVSPPAGK